MTSEEIMQVLRLTAMSRVNHPDQQRFCDKLAEVFAGWVTPATTPTSVTDTVEDMVAAAHADMKAINDLMLTLPTEVDYVAHGVEPMIARKRGPGRPKKAE